MVYTHLDIFSKIKTCSSSLLIHYYWLDTALLLCHNHCLTLEYSDAIDYILQPPVIHQQLFHHRVSSGKATTAALAIALLLCRVAHGLNQVQAHSKDQEDASDLQPLLSLGEDCTR